MGWAVAVVVAVAAWAARGWLADFVERTALVATGPVAGEPALAWAAAAASPVGPVVSPVGPVVSPVGVVASPGGVGIAAAALGGVVAWVAVGPALPALVFTAGLGFVLAPVDVRAHRLPDALVLPAYPVLAALLCFGGAAPFVRAVEGGAVAFGVLYLLAVAVPAGFGYGDVKLTGLLGAVLGWYGWSEVLAGLVYGFVYGGLCAAALLASRRLARTDRLAFGPFLLTGALTAVFVAR